jgi:hypothetical protein
MTVTLGLQQVVLETDASLVKMALEGEEYRLSALGGIITEIRLLLMSEFISFSICVCPKNCNKSADAIGAYGCRVSSDDQVTG